MNTQNAAPASRDAASFNGFGFDTSKPQSKSIPAKVDIARAARLREYVGSRGWPILAKASKYWSVPMSRLRRELGSDEGKIDSALDFIINNKIEKPKVFNCEQLRQPKVWEWIQNQIQEHQKKNPTVTVTSTAMDICESTRVCKWKWPAHCKKQLPTAVELSLCNYRNFVGKAMAIADPRIHSLADELISRTGASQSFVARWFENVGRFVAHINAKKDGGYKGDLIPRWVFTVDSPEFQKQAKNIWMRLGGNDKSWERLMTEIKT